ncbi:glycosyltransferase [Acidimicrobiaceae bacterium AH-315-P05]|nr:glycosyltransferase [Acidimicrobiaceae bacterium AH-315-P05]
MKRRLRRFLAVGLAVTALDVAILVVMANGQSWPWLFADVVAVGVASIVSFGVHRVVTFADDSHALVDHNVLGFVTAVAPAVVVDVAIVAMADVIFDASILTLLVAKALAVGAAALVRLLRYRRVLFAAVRAEQVPNRDRTEAPGVTRLSVVLPAYRAAGLVADSVARLRRELSVLEGDLQIVVVDDGSGDGTAQAARDAGADLVVELAENQGKGGAVRTGMLAANGRARIFTDIDLAYPPHQLLDLLEAIEDGADVVVGSRRHNETTTVQGAPRLRELGSLVFNVFTHVVLLGHYRDTQSGLKGFRSDAADLLFSLARIDGFAFDVELLHLAERYHLALVELPVVLDNIDDSTVSFAADTLAMIRDVFRVRRWSAQGQYDIGEAKERMVDQWR